MRRKRRRIPFVWENQLFQAHKHTLTHSPFSLFFRLSTHSHAISWVCGDQGKVGEEENAEDKVEEGHDEEEGEEEDSPFVCEEEGISCLEADDPHSPTSTLHFSPSLPLSRALSPPRPLTSSRFMLLWFIIFILDDSFSQNWEIKGDK